MSTGSKTSVFGSEPTKAEFNQKPIYKKDWAITSQAFQGLLSWLDAGRDSGGERYVEIRQRLVSFFDRKNCSTPDDLADETLNRVARRLEEEGTIESDCPEKYCYTIARFVFLEYLRSAPRHNVPLDDSRKQSAPDYAAEIASDDAKMLKERMLLCLDQCTKKLESSKREIILRYYMGKERVKIENRRALAHELGITVNALSIRACRIRSKLESCVKECLNTK
jgi:DNA-directed RNA polymerase specialized sigma24 family protein